MTTMCSNRREVSGLRLIYYSFTIFYLSPGLKSVVQTQTLCTT